MEANAKDDHDTITFDANLFKDGPATIVFNSELDHVKYSVTITGPGRDKLDISRISDNTKHFGLFTFDKTSNSKIENLSITKGYKPSGQGGAIDNSGELMISNCLIALNAAKWGGGLANVNKLTIEQSHILLNSAVEFGGGIWGSGFSSTAISKSDIYSNLSEGGRGGGIAATVQGKFELTETNVFGNSANYGGGIYTSGTQITMTKGELKANSATNQGGGIFAPNGTLTLTEVLLERNHSATQGGGIFIGAPGQLTLTGCTFVDNSAGLLGPRVVYQGILGQTITIVLNNCTGITADDLTKFQN